MTNPLPGRLVVMSGWRTKQRPAHEGIDLAAPVGTTVFAVRAGWVKLVTGNTGPYGNSIIVQHSDDDETRHNHLKHRPSFQVGNRVEGGEHLGLVGMTGRTTAPHLHFARYRLRGGRWHDVDPTTLLDFSSTAGGDSRPFTPPQRGRSKMGKLYYRTKDNKPDGIAGEWALAGTGDGEAGWLSITDQQLANDLASDTLRGKAIWLGNATWEDWKRKYRGQ